jgi:hypothetical protein
VLSISKSNALIGDDGHRLGFCSYCIAMFFAFGSEGFVKFVPSAIGIQNAYFN